MVDDKNKTKNQLLAEVQQLRQRLEHLERLHHGNLGSRPRGKAKGAAKDHIPHKNAKATLRSQEAILRTLLEALPESSVLTDLNGIVLVINSKATKRLGKRSPEIEGRCILEFLPVDIAALLKDHMGRAVQLRKPVSFRVCLAERHYEYSAFPIMDSEDGVVQLGLFGHDVTEHVQLENALLESRQVLQSAIEGTRAGLWDWQVQTGETVLNDRWAEIGGYTLEELQPISIQTWIDLCHPDDLRRSNELLQKCFRHESEFYECECRIKHKNGGWVWIFDRGKVVEWGQDGQPIRMIGTHTDVTERKRNETALRESEERFRRIAENSPDAIFRISLPDGIYQYVSPAAEKVIGYTAEELYAEPLLIARAIHPDWRDYFHREWARLLSGETLPHYEYQIVDRNGTVRWLHQHNVLVRDEHQRPVCLEGLISNITEHKHAEESLKKGTRQLSDLVEYAPFGILLTEGPEQIVRMMNSTFVRLFGYTIEDVPDVAHWWPLAYPDESYRERIRKEWTERVQQMLETHTAFCMPGVNLACKDGTVRHIDAYMACLESFDVIFFVDRTEYRHAEDLLRRSENRFRTYVNEAPDGVFIIDQLGMCTDANPAACNLLGYSYEEVITMSVGDVCLGGQAVAAQAMLQRLMESDHQSGELVFTRKDGTKFPVWIDAVQLQDGNFMAFCHDITERKFLEEQLQQAQKMEAVGRLAGGVAHDFNNLLQVINGNTDLAMQEFTADHPAFNLLEEVWKAGNRAAKVVSQLLAFSRRQVIRPEDLNLNEVISSLLKMLDRILGEHIRIDFHPGAASGHVHADRIQLEQVLVNLSVNARDAMPDGGTLTIETRNITLDNDYCALHTWAEPGIYMLLSISDTGCGISTETLEHIWEPFFTTKAVGKGTGLGLATVYGIIKQHRGMINVYSELSKGSVFKIYLPIIEAKSSPKEDQLDSQPEAGTETILLAEDEDMVRNLGRRILEKAGYTVLTACNGEEALALCNLHGEKIDLALLDVVMPGLGGRAVYQHLKKRFPRMRFLFASGYSVNAIHTDFVLQEGFELIEKPFGRAQLLVKIRHVLHNPG